MANRSWRFSRVGENEVPIQRQGVSMWDVLYSEHCKYTAQCRESRQEN